MSGRHRAAPVRARRSRRWPIVALVVAGVLLVGAAVGIVVELTGGSGSSPASAPSGSAAAPASSLLVALKAADGSAAATALLAHDPRTASGVEVLVPGRVLADVPGYGSQPYANALRLPGTAKLARSALADLMGVRVDGSWVLDGTAFSRLVDHLNGIAVDVDVDVLAPRPGGGADVVVGQGQQHLTGRTALAYVSYAPADEAPTEHLVRLQRTLDAVLARLPHDPAAVARVLGGLGGGSTADWPASRLAAFLVGFARDAAAKDVLYTNLPVQPIDTAGGTPTFRIDATALRQLVDAQLAAFVPPGLRSGTNRVLVENAVGTPGLGTSVRDRLVAAGFRFVGSRNLQPFGRAQSVVLVFSDSPAALQQGAAVAKALRLPASAVRVSPRQQSVADVVVILGRDYQP